MTDRSPADDNTGAGTRRDFPDPDTANFGQERVKTSLCSCISLFFTASLSLCLFSRDISRDISLGSRYVKGFERSSLFREHTPPLSSSLGRAIPLARRNQAELLVSRVPRDPLAFLGSVSTRVDSTLLFKPGMAAEERLG